MIVVPDKHAWRWVVVNSSGGKDSQTALRQVVLACDRQNIPRERIVVSHQCLGASEWPGTLELAEEQARHYGCRFEVTKYRNRYGENLTLLDYVEKRGKWPSSTTRYCTSDFKRGPGGRVLTMLSREAAGPVLHVYGFRADESPARAKKKVFVRKPRFSTSRRELWDWLPIHHWTTAEVWADIRESGVPYHYAYDLGMPRLSCVFCIFAPEGALMIAGRENPDLLDQYVEVERRIDHTFQYGLSLASIKARIQAGDTPGDVTEQWNM